MWPRREQWEKRAQQLEQELPIMDTFTLPTLLEEERDSMKILFSNSKWNEASYWLISPQQNKWFKNTLRSIL